MKTNASENMSIKEINIDITRGKSIGRECDIKFYYNCFQTLVL